MVLVGSLAITISFGVTLVAAIAVKRAVGAGLDTWAFWSIFCATFSVLFYISLKLVRPDELIIRLLKK
jgi:hypothetical protein